jgi:hypothetical protein
VHSLCITRVVSVFICLLFFSKVIYLVCLPQRGFAFEYQRISSSSTKIVVDVLIGFDYFCWFK